MKYAPDADGYFAGQSGYGYRSIEDFVNAALAIRAATKLVPFVSDTDKGYIGSVRLGVETDTLDAEGSVLHTHVGEFPTEAEVAAALEAFRGEISQIPPPMLALLFDTVLLVNVRVASPSGKPSSSPSL